MTRAVMVGGRALVLFLVLAGVGTPTTAASHGSAGAEGAAAQSGELVTLEELCAFRAPLLIEGGDVPAGCAATVEWLRRLVNADRACADLWVENGAIPECALAHRVLRG